MPKAMVLGVNGQDGSYLAETLLQRGYQVVGIARQEHSRFVSPSNRFHYAQLDIEDQQALRASLHDTGPDVVFHTAAIHGASGFSYEPVWGVMMSVNVMSVHTILEFARTESSNLRLVYANSSKIFPAPLAGLINEQTPIAASCLYSIGKIAALELIRHYRARHGIAGANLILFNHESRRRPGNFFLPTIARCLAGAMADPGHRVEIATLDFRVDWSSAEELMDIAIDIAEKAPADDFVLASGISWHGREAVQQIFEHHGLDYARHVLETQPGRDPGPPFQVALDHLETRTGRRPVRNLFAIVDDLVSQARAA